MKMSNTDNDGAPKPRRGRPRDPERLQRILEAARNHFYAHGLERASVDAIAAQAGFRRWPSTATSDRRKGCSKRWCACSWRPTAPN